MTRLHVALLFLLAVLSVAIHAQLGGATVAGVVKDSAGDPIPGVTVSATRAGETSVTSIAVTETDGGFRIADLRPGSYRIEAVLDGFQPVSSDVKLVTGQTLQVALSLVPAFGETVEVVGEATRTGEVEILESRRQAPVVSDSISSEEIRKTPDSSAAGVVERLTGVTLLGDKYVFVRGLGERYSGTTINGSALPTTETEKRVVPLDLFPAKLLETVNVVKTYTPDKSGDFGSGVVEMTTVDFPRATTLKIGLGSSYVSGVTGGAFHQYAGGLSAFGRGGQGLPEGIPADRLRRKSVLDPNGLTPAELQTIGQAFAGNWTGRETSSASPARDLSITFGTTLGRLGVVLSGVSNHGYNSVGEIQRYYGIDVGDVLVAVNDYELRSDRETATAGLVGNVSLRLNDANRVSFNSVLTRDASSEDRVQEGLQTNSGGIIRDFRVRYQIEEVRSNRLRGEHNFGGPGIGSLVEWSLASSRASNDSDLRENVYQMTGDDVFEMRTGLADSGKLEYFELDDSIDQAGISWSLFFADDRSAWSGTFKTGIDRLQRSRDFDARRFRFVTADFRQFDLTATPEEIYAIDNIRPDGFEIRETTGINDAYDASHEIDAAYLMSDTTFGKWRFIGGARYESSNQVVSTFNPFDTATAVDSIRENNDILPSLNVVYQLAAKTNLRFGYGRSLNRPEFRELSPFTFTEVSGGRSVSGNPALVQATIDGLDLRWETFPGDGEVLAASAFYKRIDKPIERIIQPTTDFRQSFVNADNATLWGIELELRQSLARFLPSLDRWSVNANFAHIHSNVTVGDHQLSVVTNTERPLEGQSDNVGNLALQFHEPTWGTMFRVLGSYTGERLTDVGAFGLPDIYESSQTTFDAVISQSLGPWANGIELKLAATNLLGAKRTFMQGSNLQREFDPGRKFSISLSYSPF